MVLISIVVALAAFMLPLAYIASEFMALLPRVETGSPGVGTGPIAIIVRNATDATLGEVSVFVETTEYAVGQEMLAGHIASVDLPEPLNGEVHLRVRYRTASEVVDRSFNLLPSTPQSVLQIAISPHEISLE
jgi:hypothetical protein